MNKGDDFRESVTLSPELTTPHTTPAGNGGLMPDLHPQWFYPKSNPSQKPIVLPLNILEGDPAWKNSNLGNEGGNAVSPAAAVSSAEDKSVSTGVGEEEGDLVTTDLMKSGPVTIYAPALVDDLVDEPDLGRAGETTTYQPASSKTILPAGFEKEATRNKDRRL